MYSIRKWMFKPKKNDSSALAGFFYADEELNMIAAELDGFNGRNDPERCATLVNQLRACQDKLLHYVDDIMQELIPDQCTSRDFRAKFPDDVLQESLAGQLWFGAECLAAGSSIMNREAESSSMRPLAKAFTKHIDHLRSLLRDNCLKNGGNHSQKLLQALQLFDSLFAEFELSYVSAMVPVKSIKEYDALQDIVVLFSETVLRAVKLNLLSVDMIDSCDPALMFTIPRLAIISGLLIYPEGPLNADMEPMSMSEMFRPFQMILYKIRELLWTLTPEELWELENSLCNSENYVAFKNNNINAQLNSHKLIQNENESSPHSLTQNTFFNCSGEKNCEQAEMTQSPSIITIVATNQGMNQNHCNNSNSEILETESSDCCAVSNDSGILSEGVICNSNSIEFNTDASSSQTLRYSSSWPSFDVNMKNAPNYINCDTENESYDDSNNSAQNIICTHQNTNHKYQFNLPLNTRIHSNRLRKHCRSHSLDKNFKITSSTCLETAEYTRQSWTNTLQCIFISNDNSNYVADDKLHKISLVTNTLNDVLSSDSSSTLNINDCPSSTSVTNHCEIFSNDSSNQGQTNLPHANDSNNNNDMPSTKIGLIADNDILNYRGVDMNNDLRSGNNFSPFIFKKSKKQLDNRHNMNTNETSSENAPHHNIVNIEYDWDRQSYTSTETSSYNSEYQDEEEIALAIQAAEIAARNEARSRFQSSTDLIHRLFVCISGVADQLQTNYAGDLRHILKCVFDIHSSPVLDSDDSNDDVDFIHHIVDECDDEDLITDCEEADERMFLYEAPQWVPDEQSIKCLSCSVFFTFTRRRHHCRNCGKIFCGRCSSNMAALPHFGHSKPVRICNHCFIFEINPFTS